jgi:hypothetical protein
MLDVGQQASLRQLVGDDYSRHKPQALEQSLEGLLGSFPITLLDGAHRWWRILFPMPNVTWPTTAEIADGLAPALQQRELTRKAYAHTHRRDNLLEF